MHEQRERNFSDAFFVVVEVLNHRCIRSTIELLNVQHFITNKSGAMMTGAACGRLRTVLRIYLFYFFLHAPFSDANQGGKGRTVTGACRSLAVCTAHVRRHGSASAVRAG